MGSGCNKVLKVDYLQWFVNRLYYKSAALDVCVEFQDSKNHCQELAFNVGISPLRITNGFAVKTTGMFSCTRAAPSPFSKASYMYGDWFVPSIICEFSLERVGHQGFLLLEG